MRPVLKAGLLPVWRERDTLQIGVDPRRAVALARIGPAAAVISLLDGSRDRPAVIATAQAYGVPAQAAERVLELLAVAGVLDDFPVALHRSLPAGLRCAELRKAEGDAAWPKILAQAVCAVPAATACDVALAAMTATLGAAQALAFIDGVVAPAAVNGTLEVVLPGWQWRRRTWPPHPACPCGASRPG